MPARRGRSRSRRTACDSRAPKWATDFPQRRVNTSRVWPISISSPCASSVERTRLPFTRTPFVLCRSSRVASLAVAQHHGVLAAHAVVGDLQVAGGGAADQRLGLRDHVDLVRLSVHAHDERRFPHRRRHRPFAESCLRGAYSRRCRRAGRRRRISSCRAKSSSASAKPSPSGTVHSTVPQGSITIERPYELARGVVRAPLRGGDHEALVLDRPRAQQHFPVVAPGRHA